MAKTKERFITNEKGQKLEDLKDLRLIAERKDESTVSLKQVKRSLK